MKFSSHNPYNSTRIPVFARNVVATSQPLAAQAGLRVLQQGGNAVDAAIATAAALTIVEPVSNGLGSDAFAIVWDGKRLHGLNASGRAPMAWTPEYFRNKYGSDVQTPPMRGIDAVTVPGAVAGWVALSERLGKLPFADVLAPAIELAERGHLVSSVVQHKWALAVPLLQQQAGFAGAFMPRGRAPEIGECFTFPAAALALKQISATKGEAFYKGDIAKALAKFSAECGGALAEADLNAYQPEWVEPLAQGYRGHTLHEIPPNGQGITAQMALGILEHFDIGSMELDGADCQHLLIEATKLAFADVYRHVAERGAMQVTTQEMLSPSYLASRAKLIDPKRAQDFGPGLRVQGGTVYLTAADADGMMVSFIQSNYMGFGSGCVEPTFGISLQNRGHSFAIQPDAPNQANIVAPGKRPFHTIIPAFLTKQGAPVMSFGVMGGKMQPQGHVQTLVRMLDHHQNPQAACDAPRWRFDEGLSIALESSASNALRQGLVDRGHVVQSQVDDSYMDFGAGQFIWRLGDEPGSGYVAASDPRRDGLVAGS